MAGLPIHRRTPRAITVVRLTHRLGVYLLILGALLCIVGLALGFGFMFAGHDGEATLFLAAVPLGFVAGFAGIVMTLLNPPDTSD